MTWGKKTPENTIMNKSSVKEDQSSLAAENTLKLAMLYPVILPAVEY